MKTNKPKLLILLVIFCKITILASQNLNLKIMSFNVQQPYSTNWDGRKANAAYIINTTQADIIGTQEAVNYQRDYLIQQTGYAWFGIGRDGGDNGEGSWIFYKGDKYNLDTANSGNFWLSDTPNTPSRFGGAYNRICTYVHLIEKSSGKGFYLFNAHFPTPDLPNERLKSMKLLAQRMANRAIQSDPVYLTGDFNSNEGDSVTLWMKNGSDNPIKCRDTYRDVFPSGNVDTGFGTKFDYIYCVNNSNYSSQNSWVIKTPVASDHFPIVAQVQYAFQNNPPLPVTHNIPGTIEAEQYASQFGTQLENTTDSGLGQNVGYLEPNDWMDYNVNISATDNYTFELRIASMSANGQLNVFVDGQYNQTLSMPLTNGWQNWETIIKSINLPSGLHTVRLEVVTGGFNLNWFKLTKPNFPPSGLVIPGKIEAENYSFSYGIQLEDTSDAGGGKNVGYLDVNDILEYNVTVATSNNYNFDIRVASLSSSGRINVLVDNQIKKTIDLPITNGWQNWQTLTEIIYLPQGAHTIKLEVVRAGFNLNWFHFTAASNVRQSLVSNEKSLNSFYPNPTTDFIYFNQECQWIVYDLTGKEVAKGRSQIADLSRLDEGIYMVHFKGERKKLIIN